MEVQNMVAVKFVLALRNDSFWLFVLFFFEIQTLGTAELALTQDCFYSQVTAQGCCGDQGLLRIPVLTVKDIRQQSCKIH